MSSNQEYSTCPGRVSNNIESSRLSVPGLAVKLWDQTSRIDQGMQKSPNLGFCRLEEPFIGQVKCQCFTVS